jgi:D-alanine-D-alanine ligase-like ATP-grasp enzyme
MRLLSQYDKEFGFVYCIDKEKDDFGRIEFDNGVRHYVSRTDIRVNQVGPHEIVKDKFQTDQFLKEYGYPTVPSRLFYSENFRSLYTVHYDGLEDALSYGTSLGFPLIVKPNNGLHGNHVHKVNDEKQLKRAILKTFRSYDKVLVQQFAEGHDYRIIVYRNNFISAYRRIPLTLTGDGKRSILTMLEDKIVEAEQENRSIHFDLDTIKIVLKRKKMRLNTVLKEGQSVRLLDNANLSTGGTAEDVTNEIHSDYIDAAIKASQDLHLNLSGVDLMIQGDITKKPEDNHWFFLELNGSPGFDWYSRIGKEQEERIHGLFKMILSDIRKGDYLCP